MFPNNLFLYMKIFEQCLLLQVDGVSVRELSEKQIVMLTKAKRINMNIKRYITSEEGIFIDFVTKLCIHVVVINNVTSKTA